MKKEQLKQRWLELYNDLPRYTERIRALRKEISQTLDEERLVILKEKLQDREEIRANLYAELETIEQTIGPMDTAYFTTDGQLTIPNTTNPQLPTPPLETANTQFITNQPLTVPRGAIPLSDSYYIKRVADDELQTQIIGQRTLTTVQAPRQTGKTSLLMRGVDYAQKQGLTVVFIDFQPFQAAQLISLDALLQELAYSIIAELNVVTQKREIQGQATHINLDENLVEKAWQSKRSAHRKLTSLLEQKILPQFNQLVLIFDEADKLLATPFRTEFFSLLRFWFNRGALHNTWAKLNIVVSISTEAALLIDDPTQSPFNVGLKLTLKDFNQQQVSQLNDLYNRPVDEQELPALITLFNGHPYLTRYALYTMTTKNIRWSQLSAQASNDDGIFREHLQHQVTLLTQDLSLKQAMQAVLATGKCADTLAISRLLRAGLIKEAKTGYICRCDLYRRYFEQYLF